MKAGSRSRSRNVSALVLAVNCSSPACTLYFGKCMFGFASNAQSTSMLAALLARAYNSFEAFKLASRNREQRIQFLPPWPTNTRRES